ncbi:unnamed protein product [Cuscuta campestris]|uniref:Uncharacterized protein n=1 Tax=Cuscuta campestris TaxID=132261 RepID=A0A484LWH6_9ASTE|nr:unnamed protein product [Cuscuta campestris]
MGALSGLDIRNGGRIVGKERRNHQYRPGSLGQRWAIQGPPAPLPTSCLSFSPVSPWEKLAAERERKLLAAERKRQVLKIVLRSIKGLGDPGGYQELDGEVKRAQSPGT